MDLADAKFISVMRKILYLTEKIKLNGKHEKWHSNSCDFLCINNIRLSLVKWIYLSILMACRTHQFHSISSVFISYAYFGTIITVRIHIFYASSPSREKGLLASPCQSSCLSVCPHVSERLPLDGFWWNLVRRLLQKSVKKLQIWLQSDINIRHVTWRSKCVSYFW
jgi:hypothetical protein